MNSFDYLIVSCIIFSTIASLALIGAFLAVLFMFRDKAAYPFTHAESIKNGLFRAIDGAWLCLCDHVAGTKCETMSKRKARGMLK